jgi:prepilin-type N-terminal cleavage/methylation domain-containing protein
MKTRGFTLIEMLITLALVLVMASMLLGRTSRSRQERDLANCSKNLQMIFATLTIYSADNNAFPKTSNAQTSEAPLSLLVPRCTTDTAIFICPGTKDKPIPQAESFADHKISYAYYMGWKTNVIPSAPLVSDRQVNTRPKREKEPLFSADGKSTGENHDKYGGNVLFASGEIQRSKPKSAFDLVFPTNVVLLNPKP